MRLEPIFFILFIVGAFGTGWLLSRINYYQECTKRLVSVSPLQQGFTTREHSRFMCLTLHVLEGRNAMQISQEPVVQKILKRIELVDEDYMNPQYILHMERKNKFLVETLNHIIDTHNSLAALNPSLVSKSILTKHVEMQGKLMNSGANLIKLMKLEESAVQRQTQEILSTFKYK